MRAILRRFRTGDQGTCSTMILDTGFSCRFIELPDRNNEPSYSRINSGKYHVVPFKSPKFGNVYILKNVEGRSYILTHSGNYAGDTKLGYKSHSHGCLIIGEKFCKLAGQLAVVNSRITLNKFIRELGGEEFDLEIFDEV